MIEAHGLTKRYGATVAVDDLSFTVPPGQVTGFLGPNGAGKSTTMRLILGLDAPDSGSVTVGGRPYAAWRRPLFQAGALLEAKAFHGGRTARSHLLCLADSNGISRTRVGEVLALVGELASSGRTIVMATHEMAFARDVADAVCFLDGGKIVESGSAKQVLTDPQQDRTRQFLRRFTGLDAS